MMYNLFTLFLSLFTLLTISAQTSFCPEDPPLNPFLADSPWPTYHRNNYRQSSTCLMGPTSKDELRVKVRSQLKGGTSPWTYFSEKYPNGQRVLLQSNSSHVFKLIDEGNAIVAVDSLRIDFDVFTSFGWNFLLTKDKVWFTYNPRKDASTILYKLTDKDKTDPYSKIKLVDELDLGDFGINRTQHFSLNYRGEIVFNSENDEAAGHATIGVISQDFKLLDTLRYSTEKGEITHHNAFPVDEFNSFFITTSKRLIKFSWDGNDLTLDWEIAYDFVGDGPTGTFAEGSGTTPTLMGWGDANDKLVVMSDGHARNNLVGFWREIPADWEGIPGKDIRFAGSIEIPAARSFNNTFQSIENSPTVFGYSVGIAQFNGFLGYDCENIKGVQRIDWNTEANKFEVVWVNREINMNGILTYSKGSNLVYSSGKEEDCNYYYYGLNWDSGELELRKRLGPQGTLFNDPFYDGGNNSIIDEDGNIYFAGGASLVKVENKANTTSSEALSPTNFIVKPNPARNLIYLDFPDKKPFQLTIYNTLGQVVLNRQQKRHFIKVADLPAGLYSVVVQIPARTGKYVSKFLKR